MIKTERQGVWELFKISIPYILFSTAYMALVLLVEENLGDQIYSISGQIGSVFGLAVAFFLGFRMNSAYDRWWEARKILGELTTTTRSFVVKLAVYASHAHNLPRKNDVLPADFFDLTALFVRQLNLEIRSDSPVPHTPETHLLFSRHGIRTDKRVSNEILVALTHSIEENFAPESRIEKADLMQHINRLFEIQGKAERIRNTPFLKIYSAFTRIMVFSYVLILPLFIGDIDLGGETSGLEFIAIPVMAFISTAFLTINRLANIHGEPFSKSRTSVSMDEICQGLEAFCVDMKTKVRQA